MRYREFVEGALGVVAVRPMEGAPKATGRLTEDEFSGGLPAALPAADGQYH
jgi:hypothetical protein